jgi:hypothetical protein
MKRSPTGRYIESSTGEETVMAFVPNSLPARAIQRLDFGSYFDEAEYFASVRAAFGR